MPVELLDFSPDEKAMIHEALVVLAGVGYDTGLFQVLIRTDMPVGYRGMSLDDGAAVGAEAFHSQAMLNHVLEEELRHLMQKAKGDARVFGPRSARYLEEEADESRYFPAPPA
jgi:hypothetical protein